MESAIAKGQSYVLTSGHVAKNGEFACLVVATGLAAVASVATGLKCIGVFDTPRGADVTGDGSTVSVRIRFMDEGECLIADNDVTDAVATANIGSTVYLFDGHTVSSDATGTSAAGTAVAFRGTKILVKPTGF